MRERRRHERFTPAEEVVGKVKATVPARIVDISPFGAQVEVASALRPAVVCDLSVPVGDGTIRLRARVQRCRASSIAASGGGGAKVVYRAGLEFVDLSDGDQQTLLAAYGPQGTLEAPASGTPRRRGPITIRVNPRDILKRRADG